MENVFSVLALIACPVGMGLMMWLMMRNQNAQMNPMQSPPNQRGTASQSPMGLSPVWIAESASEGRSMRKMGGLCLNWKVVAGLAVVGLLIWMVVPDAVGAALPLLLLAACPLSMLLMMRGMRGGQCQAQSAPVHEMPGVGLADAEQLVALKAQFRQTQDEQERIAREIADLEGATSPAVQEAEAVARAADARTAT